MPTGMSKNNVPVQGTPKLYTIAPMGARGEGENQRTGENKGEFEIEEFHAQAGGRWIVRPLGSVTTSGNWHFAGRSRGMCA